MSMMRDIVADQASIPCRGDVIFFGITGRKFAALVCPPRYKYDPPQPAPADNFWKWTYVEQLSKLHRRHSKPL